MEPSAPVRAIVVANIVAFFLPARPSAEASAAVHCPQSPCPVGAPNPRLCWGRGPEGGGPGQWGTLPR